MADSSVIRAGNLLVEFMKEEDIDPTVGMVAMVQLAAKISFDSSQQEKLSDKEARDRWMVGAMTAYDAAAGGKAGFETDQQPRPRHLSLCPGVGKGSKQGFQQRVEKNRAANKQARKTRRTNRGKR